jgi:hypothetical protein
MPNFKIGKEQRTPLRARDIDLPAPNYYKPNPDMIMKTSA